MSDESEDFVRDYEVPSSWTLLEFHKFINDELGYRVDEMSSFFRSDKNWEKLQEFTLLDMGVEGVDIDPDDDIEPPMPMTLVKIHEAIDRANGRLIYVFDLLNERCLYMQLIEFKDKEAGIAYPRVTLSEGNAPKQLIDSIHL